jgi:6-phosphogluconolactonase
MSQPWIIPCRDDAHAAAETARTVLDAFVSAGERNFALALSGGRIAPHLFKELVQQARSRRTPLAEADFFWADERCVPPTHAESNLQVARTHLLDPLAVPGHHVHRLAGGLPPADAVAQANADWAAWAVRRGAAAARLDCVLLGVGEDGHVASLFPGNLGTDWEAHAPFRAVIGPKPPPQRLTLGYGPILDARQVVVLATGTGKEDILRRALAGDPTLPLGRILAGRKARNAETLLVSPLKFAPPAAPVPVPRLPGI